MPKRLVLERRHFKVLAEVLDIVNASSVPVEELQIVGCTWDYDNLGLWNKCRKGTSREQECPYGCRVPAPPSSLQFADINVPLSGNQAHPLSLALWLSHSRTPSLTVRWSFRFSLFDERRGMTAQVLEVLGTRLIEVSFSAVGPRRWDNSFQDTTFPSLSHNTELKTLNLTYVVPGLCPPSYLASVVSKVSSSGLENLYFRFHVDHTGKEHLGLEYFDFKALGEVLSPAGFPKFPQLRKLTFCLYLKKELAAQVVSNPPNLRLQQRVFKEIPFLRNWQEGFGLRVDTPTKIV